MDVQLVRLDFDLIGFLLFLGLFKKSADPFSQGSIVYTPEQLLALCNTKVLPVERPEIPHGNKEKEKGMWQEKTV